MGRRFEELEDVYNTLSAIEFNFDSLPANNKYRKYKEWKQDPELRKLPAGSRTDSGAKQPVGLLAFGLPSLDDADHVLVRVGQRAFNQITAIPNNALLNLTTSAIPDSYIRLGGFVPAKAIFGLRGGTATPTSKITGQEYKQTIQRSYTVPFGKGTGAGKEHEFDVQNAIIGDAGISADYVVTFTPEKITRR